MLTSQILDLLGPQSQRENCCVLELGNQSLFPHPVCVCVILDQFFFLSSRMLMKSAKERRLVKVGHGVM